MSRLCLVFNSSALLPFTVFAVLSRRMYPAARMPKRWAGLLALVTILSCLVSPAGKLKLLIDNSISR